MDRYEIDATAIDAVRDCIKAFIGEQIPLRAKAERSLLICLGDLGSEIEFIKRMRKLEAKEAVRVAYARADAATTSAAPEGAAPDIKKSGHTK